VSTTLIKSDKPVRVEPQKYAEVILARVTEQLVLAYRDILNGAHSKRAPIRCPGTPPQLAAGNNKIADEQSHRRQSQKLGEFATSDEAVLFR
jgi:hypothetical protein